MSDSQADEISKYLKEIAFNLQKLDDDLSGRNHQYKLHKNRGKHRWKFNTQRIGKE